MQILLKSYTKGGYHNIIHAYQRIQTSNNRLFDMPLCMALRLYYGLFYQRSIISDQADQAIWDLFSQFDIFDLRQIESINLEPCIS